MASGGTHGEQPAELAAWLLQFAMHESAADGAAPGAEVVDCACATPAKVAAAEAAAKTVRQYANIIMILLL